MHIVRRYNGEWVNASGAIPFTMNKWQVMESAKEYDGILMRGKESREACECKTASVNGVRR